MALHGRIFYLARRMIAQCAVGTLTVIKLNIRINATLELCLRGIILSVEFFFFQRGEKGFRHLIVMDAQERKKAVAQNALGATSESGGRYIGNLCRCGK